MSSERVIFVEGTRDLPEAAQQLLEENCWDAVFARCFLGPESYTRAFDVFRGSTLHPKLLGAEPCDALETTGDVVRKWVHAQEFGNLALAEGGGFNGLNLGKARLGRTALHIDAEMHGFVYGPLTMSIGFGEKGEWRVARGEPELDANGHYEPAKHATLVASAKRRYRRSRKEFSRFTQGPGDLVMFANTPCPSVHGVPRAGRGRIGMVYDYHLNIVRQPSEARKLVASSAMADTLLLV